MPGSDLKILLPGIASLTERKSGSATHSIQENFVMENFFYII